MEPAQAAEAARAAPPGPQPPSLIDLLLDALTARFTKPYEAALPSLRRALDALAGPDGRGDDEVRWLWFACPVTPEPLAPEVWDDGEVARAGDSGGQARSRCRLARRASRTR